MSVRTNQLNVGDNCCRLPRLLEKLEEDGSNLTTAWTRVAVAKS